MSGKMKKFKDLLVDTPNRYTVNGEVKTIVFAPNAVTQEGTKDKAEYFNEMQKNGLYNVNATRVVEGTVEFYDIAIEGSDIFDVFDTQFIINFNETNTKLNPVLRFNGNNYYIRMIESFIDVDVPIGYLQKTCIGFLDSSNNKLKLFRNERKLTFDTVADLQTATWLVEGDIIEVLGYYSKGDGGEAIWTVSSSNDINGISLLTPNGMYLNIKKGTYSSARAIGWKKEKNSVDMYTLLRLFVENELSYNSYKKINTMSEISYNIEAGLEFPIAFYGDSTTDGATTTDHLASYVNGSINTYTSPIVMNISPNAYCKKLEEMIKEITFSSNPVKIYNCGFDSMSYSNGFGNKCFHRVFYGYDEGLNNMDFSDVKAIFSAFGTSDSINIAVTDVLNLYPRNIEMFVINCFERGVQPYIVDPVYHFQGVDNSESYRRNWETITIINNINDEICRKYGLERLSLGKSLQDYTSFESGENGEWDILATDGVHPNDMGHRLLAGYFASQFCKRIKIAEPNYKFTPRNPYTIALKTEAYDDIYPIVDTSGLITHTKFFKKYPLRSSGEFLERLFIYCEKPVYLFYNKLSVNKTKLSGSSSTNDIKVTCESYTKNKIYYKYLNVDRNNFPVIVSGSHLEVIRLEVGLNKIQSNAPKYLTSPTDIVMGFFFIDRDYSINELTKPVAISYKNKINHFGDLVRLVSSASTNTRTRGGEFEFYKDDYYYALDDQQLKISFITSKIDKRKIRFCYNRKFTEYDTYNEVTIEGTTCTLAVVTPEGANVVGTITLTEDVSLNTTDTMYSIVITNNTSTGQTFYLQKITSSGTISNIGSKTNLGFTTGLLTDGYGFGVSKYFAADNTAIVFKNINVEAVNTLDIQNKQ